MLIIDYMVNMHHWPHGNLPRFEIWTPRWYSIGIAIQSCFIWYDTSEVMIEFTMLFISNVLQKLILTIIIFVILCPIFFLNHSKQPFQILCIFNILKKETTI